MMLEFVRTQMMSFVWKSDLAVNSIVNDIFSSALYWW
jgi:hypothetical protein